MKERILQILENNPYLSAKEIGKIVGLAPSTVNKHLSNLGIHRDRKLLQRLNNTSREKILKITDNAEQIILGSILGDGYMSPNRHPENTHLILNSELRINHGVAQKEYIQYKKDLLEKEGIKCTLKERKIPKKEHYIKGILVKENGGYYLKTCRNVSFNFYRNLFYRPNKKLGKYIYKLKALGLAIWFMDDGFRNGNSWTLCTNGFTFKEAELLRTMLKHNFNLETSIHTSIINQPMIYIKACSRETFLNLVKPYICNSMLYKIGVLKSRESAKVLS